MDGATDSEALTPLLPRLLVPLWRRWWLMPLGMVVMTALVLAFVARSQPVWTAEMSVYAAPSSSGVAPRRGLAGLAAQAGGLAGLAGGSEAAPPFRYFLDGLATPDVAARLARDQALMRQVFPGEWDAQARQWREPSRGFVGGVRAFVFGILGLRVAPWTPPDAVRLRLYIAEWVTVRTSVRSPLVTLSHVHPDPVFAAAFLERVGAAADAELRRAQAARTAANIRYLGQRLRATREEETRLSLVEALAEEERGAMLSASGLPYAAEPFARAAVGRWPTSPRPLPLLLAGLVVGLMLGAALALWLGWRERRA